MAEDTSTTDDAESERDDAPPENTAPTGTTGRKDDVPPEVKAALRKANKEAADLRLKLKEFEDRDKSDAQKLTERAAAAEKAATDAQAQLLRYQVAAAKQLPADLAEFLTASDQKGLEEQADRLLQRIGGKTPSFDNGARGTSADGVTDMNSLIRQSLRRG